MAIVLNEYEWAEKMINERRLGKKPGETLARVAKYYFENNYSKKEVRKLLDQFLIQCDPDASLMQWSDTLDKIVKSAARYQLIQIDGVPIFQSELDLIDTLPGRQMKRLAFAVICVAKYWNAVSASNNSWLNTDDKEIFQMANVTIPSRQHDVMYGKLREIGLIRLSKKIDNLNVQVLCLSDGSKEDDHVAMVIKDYRNLGYQYMMYYGGPYFICEHCGITVPVKNCSQKKSLMKGGHVNDVGRKPKYCSVCAAEIRIKQNVDAVMRRRHLKV